MPDNTEKWPDADDLWQEFISGQVPPLARSMQLANAIGTISELTAANAELQRQVGVLRGMLIESSDIDYCREEQVAAELSKRLKEASDAEVRK